MRAYFPEAVILALLTVFVVSLFFEGKASGEVLPVLCFFLGAYFARRL